MDAEEDLEFNHLGHEYFFEREKQIHWLEQNSSRRGYGPEPLIIWGLPGVGKTTLLKAFFNSRRSRDFFQYGNPFWCRTTPSLEETFSLFQMKIEEERQSKEQQRDAIDWQLSVIFDDADLLDDKNISILYRKTVNYKRVRRVYFISRRHIKLEHSKSLELHPITEYLATKILERELNFELSKSQLDRAVQLIRGLPAAAELLAKLINLSGPEGLDRILDGHLYDLQTTESGLLLPAATPKIITVQNQLALDLKRRPSDVHKINPREFEELIAELLSDMGLEVKLTPKANDGGRDILAFIHSGIGKHLCLVEAKKYREDRKVGIGLVRSLYGVLTDEHANSAMMVTTSSFTKPAQQFQQKY
jgi:restriction system protein